MWLNSIFLFLFFKLLLVCTIWEPHSARVYLSQRMGLTWWQTPVKFEDGVKERLLWCNSLYNTELECLWAKNTLWVVPQQEWGPTGFSQRRRAFASSDGLRADWRSSFVAVASHRSVTPARLGLLSELCHKSTWPFVPRLCKLLCKPRWNSQEQMKESICCWDFFFFSHPTSFSWGRRPLPLLCSHLVVGV